MAAHREPDRQDRMTTNFRLVQCGHMCKPPSKPLRGINDFIFKWHNFIKADMQDEFSEDARDLIRSRRPGRPMSAQETAIRTACGYALESPSPGRPKIIRQCDKCNARLGAREMRKHQSDHRKAA